MNTYLARVLLDDKKVSLLVEGLDEQSVKNELRNKGYSVVQVQAASPEDIDSFYIFEVVDPSWEKKQGKIESSDILSAYKKLVEDLGYSVEKIYTAHHITPEDQERTTQKVKKLYEISQDEKKDKVDKVKRAKEALSQKKVAKAQILLLETQEVIQGVINTYMDDSTFVVQFEPHITELKKAKNISNIGKIEEVARGALVFCGEMIMKDPEKQTTLKSQLPTINKLIKKAGGSKKFIVQKQKKEAKLDLKSAQASITNFIKVTTTHPKKDEFSRLKNVLARRKYIEEIRRVLKNPFKWGTQEMINRLGAIEERLIETGEKKTVISLFSQTIHALIGIIFFALSLFSVFMFVGYVYGQVQYSFLIFVCLLHLFALLYLFHASKIYLVLWVALSILLGVLIPNF